MDRIALLAVTAIEIFSLIGLAGRDAHAQPALVLKSVEQIKQLNSVDQTRGLSVDLECIVMCYEPTWPILFVSDGRHGMYCGNIPNLSLKRGDRIRLRGEFAGEGFPVNCTYDRSSNGIELPPPKSVDFESLQFGEEDSQHVEIEGQLVGIAGEQHQTTLEMRTHNGGRFRGILDESKIQTSTLRGMLGKKLRLRGVVGARFDDLQRWSGFQIWLSEPENIEELENAGQPFELPLNPISELNGETILRTKSSYFRTAGIVTYRLSPAMVLLQDDTHQLFVELSKGSTVALDRSYDVTGTLDTSVVPSILRMAEATPASHSFSIVETSTLYHVGELVAGDFSGQFVRTVGTYAGPIEVRGQRGFLLRSKGNLLPVFLDDGFLGEVVKGTTVEVQGIWIQQKSLVGFNIGSCALHARETGIKLGTQMPWLLLSVLGVAGGATGVSCIWAVTLRRQVGRKTQQILDSVALQRRTEEQYADIFINARVMVMTTDAAGRITAVNPAALRVICRDEPSLLGVEVTGLVHEGSLPILQNLLRTAEMSEQVQSGQVQLLGINNTAIPQEVSCWATHSDGICSLHLIWHDISERLRIEQQRSEMEQQMLSMQKMESLGALAGGIAHDFNNLLTVIVANASLLDSSRCLDREGRDNVGSIHQAATRAAELTQQMLAYAGRGRFDVRVLDVSKLISEMSPLLIASVSKSTQLLFSSQENLPGVKADATQLKQVLMNLVLNASEAMEGRPGPIRIGVFTANQPPAFELKSNVVTTFSEAVNDISQGFVCLEVSDEGNGMDESIMARIFDPFFTTKFSGRGLGLSTVIGIVRGHHGCLQVRSEKGSGTTFCVYLPTCLEPVTSLLAPHFSPRCLDAPAHVIAVDDEPSVLGAIAGILEMAEVQVTACSSGEEALRALANPKIRFDCLITDLTMPGMSGLELCESVRQMRSDLPIILCSGYSFGQTAREHQAAGVRAILQKPFQSRELIDLVLNILAETRAENGLSHTEAPEARTV